MTTQRFFSFLIVSLFIFTLAPIAGSIEESTWWNAKWSYRQELAIPFDTSTDMAKFQPIDLHITFDYPCWVKNEQEHSLRIITQDADILNELESQIYDLNFSDETHIKACNLVFLIPEQATGKEQYYLYYSEEETPYHSYPDHLKIEEAYYSFAPIPGYPFESDYYKITEDGAIVYGIAMSGKFLGYSTAQQVTLFKEHTTTVTSPQDGLAFASFDYFYYYGEHLEDFASTIQQLISKEIFIDGNLMVSCGIVSETATEDFRTTATYKYYYNPDVENRRIYAHVKHEALKASQVTDVLPNSESTGNIASLQVGSIKSPSIKELNFGQMFPYLHISAQNNRTLDYPLDMNPDYTPEGITIINTENNIDFGKKAWVCFDEGTTGIAHAFIFGSPHILVSGTDERDGVQIKAVEGAGPGLLGLRSAAQTFYCSRNSYEKETPNDLIIPADFIVEFDVEFFSPMQGGYPAVDNESTIFQAAVKTRPSQQGEVSGEVQKQNTYVLRAFVHLAPSMPMGTTFALLTGKNFSYISAELYRQEELLINNIVGRVAITSIPSFSNAKLLKKINMALGIFDWKNLTFFKKIQFDNLLPGTYLVKIYKEHPLFSHDRKYIGYTIVDLTKDSATHIFCRPEGHIDISVQDQEGTNVEDVRVRLLSGTIAISETQTTSDKSTPLSAPCFLRDPYELQLIYKGFLLYDKPLSLHFFNCLIPRKISLEIPLYDLIIHFEDLWGVPPSEILHPTLTSSEMKNPVILTAKPIDNGQYVFENLYPATYHLQVSHQSYLLQQNITIPLKEGPLITLVIPTEFNVTLVTYDSRGMSLSKTTVILERNGITVELDISEDGQAFTQLPPGIYTATVYHDDKVIGKRTLTVISERSFDLVTTEEPLFPLVVAVLSIGLFIFGALIFLRKKDVLSLLKILAVTLAIISLVFPWWTIQGSSTDPVVKTMTHLYFVPSNLISFTTTATVIAGERASASVPTLFTMFINVLTLSVLISAIFILLHMIFHNYHRKKISMLFLLIGSILLVVSLCAFYVVMSVITKVGVGGVFGQGAITANIPGENIQVLVSSYWGLDSGFYLCSIAFILLLASFFFLRKKYKIS